jgi:hypothetical protein
MNVADSGKPSGGAIYPRMELNVPMLIETAGEKYLPGRESAVVSEACWAAWRMLNAARAERRPFHRPRPRLHRSTQGRWSPGWSSK